MLIGDLLAKGRVTFAAGFDKWEDAVKLAAEPLLRDGAISVDYVTAMIDSINKYGPYIVIAPDIAMPHAQGGAGVNETSIAFMKVENPVHFSDSSEHDARLFFVLASVDNSAHIDMLQALVEEISDDALVEQLLKAKNSEDLKAIVG